MLRSARRSRFALAYNDYLFVRSSDPVGGDINACHLEPGGRPPDASHLNGRRLCWSASVGVFRRQRRSRSQLGAHPGEARHAIADETCSRTQVINLYNPLRATRALRRDSDLFYA